MTSIPTAIQYFPVAAEECEHLRSSISDLMSTNGTSLSGWSSEEAVALEETFRKVHLQHWIFPQSLTLLVVRHCQFYPSGNSTIP